MRFTAVLALSFALGILGCADTSFRAGKAAYERGDYEAAAELLRPLAAQGDAEAQYLLAHVINSGHGSQENDFLEAVELFRSAAIKGHSEAQYWMGSIYHLGSGVARDDAEAIAWFRQVQGDWRRKAADKIATIYGCQGNMIEAVKWSQAATIWWWPFDTAQRFECGDFAPYDYPTPPHDPLKLLPWRAAPDARKAIAKGDLRFVAVYGFSYYVPGVAWDYDRGTSGLRFVEGTSDFSSNLWEALFNETAYSYAEAYNTVILANSRHATIDR
jgi:hypothetical protein